MMLNDDRKNDFKKMMKGKAVYMAVSACVLAAGLVGYRATLSRLAPGKTQAEETEIVTYLHVEDRRLPESATAPPPAAVQPEPATQAPATAPAETAAPVFDNAAAPLETAEAPTAAQAETPVFSVPLSYRVGQTYSMGVPVFSQTMGDYRTHNGVDFPGDRGEAVRAVAPGVVTAVTDSPLYGNTVTVDHGNGIESRIAGLADAGLIRVGETVTAETVVGLVEGVPAEAKEGAHVHLELRVDGRLVDPLDYLGIEAPEE